MTRKLKIIRWVGVFGFLVLFAGAGRPVHSKDLSWGAINDATRFQVLQSFKGEAVLDRETGLIWQKSPASKGVIYTDAQTSCLRATTGGRMGWRMPTFEELASLRTTEMGLANNNSAALPAGHPFQNVVPMTQYWTTTTDPNDSADVRQLSFAKSCGTSIICFQGRGKTDGSPVDPVWCVRGGPGHNN